MLRASNPLRSPPGSGSSSRKTLFVQVIYFADSIRMAGHSENPQTARLQHTQGRRLSQPLQSPATRIAGRAAPVNGDARNLSGLSVEQILLRGRMRVQIATEIDADNGHNGRHTTTRGESARMKQKHASATIRPLDFSGLVSKPIWSTHLQPTLADEGTS
jgi:hypothetical protein